MLKRTVIIGSLILSLVAVVFAAIYVDSRETVASRAGNENVIAIDHDASWSIQPGTTAKWKSGILFRRNTTNSDWDNASWWPGFNDRDDKSGTSGNSFEHGKEFSLNYASDGAMWYKPYSWILIQDSYGNYYNNKSESDYPCNLSSGDAIYVPWIETDNNWIYRSGNDIIHGTVFLSCPSGSYKVTSYLYEKPIASGSWTKISQVQTSTSTSNDCHGTSNYITHSGKARQGYEYKAWFKVQWSISSPQSISAYRDSEYTAIIYED